MKCPKGHKAVIFVDKTWNEAAHLSCVMCGWKFFRLEEENIEQNIPKIIPSREKEEIMDENMKKCTKCGQEKAKVSDFFSPDRKAKDGFFWWCRECQREARKKYYIGKDRKGKDNKKRNYRTEYARMKARKLVSEGQAPKNHSSAIVSASPEEIVKALQKGTALRVIEDMQMILKKIHQSVQGESF